MQEPSMWTICNDDKISFGQS